MPTARKPHRDNAATVPPSPVIATAPSPAPDIQGNASSPATGHPGPLAEHAALLANTVMLEAKDLAGLLKICRAEFYRLLAAGRMPAPIKLGRRSLWLTATIREWIAAECPPASRWRPAKA